MIVIKKILKVISITIFLLALCGCFVHEPNRYQAATIDMTNGKLCIGISNTHNSRSHPPTVRILSITATTPSQTGEKVLDLTFPDDADGKYLLHPGSCLPLDGLPSAPRFEPQKRYSLSLVGYAGKKQDFRLFSANFCLDDRTSPPTLRKLANKIKNGHLDWSACGITPTFSD